MWENAGSPEKSEGVGVFVNITTPRGPRAKNGFKLALFGFVPFWVFGCKVL